MQHPTIFAVLLFGLFSCGPNPIGKKPHTDITQKMIVTKEQWTLYSKQDSLFHVKRLLLSNKDFILLSYDLNTGRPEATVQTFIGSVKLSDENEAIKIKSQSSNFNWTPKKGIPTLFVQIDGKAFKNDMEMLNKRENILKNIESALQLIGQSEWVGSDLGPGGVNMLFEVSNIDNAMPVILEVLQKEGIDKKTKIGRRINTAEEDWFYEVLYPDTFNGVFLTM